MKLTRPTKDWKPAIERHGDKKKIVSPASEKDTAETGHENPGFDDEKKTSKF